MVEIINFYSRKRVAEPMEARSWANKLFLIAFDLRKIG